MKNSVAASKGSIVDGENTSEPSSSVVLTTGEQGRTVPEAASSATEELRRLWARSRWPRKQLLGALLDWMEAVDRVNRLDVAEAFRRRNQAPNGEQYAAAVRTLAEAYARLEEEHDYVANVYLSTFAHALDRKAEELADQLVQAFELPAVRIALVAKLESLLGQTFDSLIGRMITLEERLEVVEDIQAKGVE